MTENTNTVTDAEAELCAVIARMEREEFKLRVERDRYLRALQMYDYCRHAIPQCTCTTQAKRALGGLEP